jgi:hypothetical protein
MQQLRLTLEPAHKSKSRRIGPPKKNTDYHRQ